MAPVLLRPARNLVANLVYAETGRNVTLSMVAGKVIYKDGQFTNVNVDDVHTRLLEASERLQAAVAADPLTDDLPIVGLTRAGKM
jgi:cytosine/adenosine deaminase-related metal-dependent hydrolase